MRIVPNAPFRTRRLNKSVLWIAGLFFIFLAMYQGLPSPANVPVPDAARRGFESIRPERLAAILTFLASDELEGRDTGQRGLKLAAKFLESQYRLVGLTPVPGQASMLQRIPILETRIDTSSRLTVSVSRNESRLSHEFTVFKDFLSFSASPKSTSLSAPVAFAGFGAADSLNDYDDLKGLAGTGKILLLLAGVPAFTDSSGHKIMSVRRARSRAAINRAKHSGAAGVFVVSNRILPRNARELNRRRNRTSLSLRSSESGDDLPVLYVGEAVADSLLSGSGWSTERLRAAILSSRKPRSFDLANVSVALDINILTEEKETQNVVAYLEGSDPALKREVVAFGAHYDHVGVDADGNVFNGADDDGSGTTAMLEIARAFATNPVRPKRSLLFVSHAGEERGLLGSRYYTDNPLLPLDSTVAQLNMDMIGRNAEDSVYVIGSDFLSSELHEINEAAGTNIGLKLDYKYNSVDDPNRFYFRSDHYNYARHGIPIIFYFSGLHRDYHRPTDTVEKINFNKLARVAQLVYLTGWSVADRDQRPRVDGKVPEIN